MTRKKTLVSVAAVSGLLAVLFAQNSAFADTNVGSTTTLAAVGSDTSQDVMEGLSSVLKDADGNALISNYKATAVGRTISTRTGVANCTFTAPRNSGEGRDALSAAIRGVSFGGAGAANPVISPDLTGCVDVARSSSGGNPTSSPGIGTMTYIPFATDSVTFAVRSVSTLPHKLNVHSLTSIYTANGTPGSTACLNAAPLIPSAGSGTRSFFATVLGITDGTIGATGSWGSCVRDTNAAGTPVQEHDGRFLTAANQIVPFSTAQFVGQQSATIQDLRGSATLGAIDFGASGTANAVSPVGLQTSFGSATRPLYNVVATSALSDARVAQTFVGASSKVCQAVSTIQQYGLAVSGGTSPCGATTKTNTN